MKKQISARSAINSARNNGKSPRDQTIADNKEDVILMHLFFVNAGLCSKKATKCAEECVCSPQDVSTPRKLFYNIKRIDGFLLSLGMDQFDANMVLEYLDVEFNGDKNSGDNSSRRADSIPPRLGLC
jgi:hypothetical protein